MDPLREYQLVWRAGGDEAVAARWPDDPFVLNVPPSREFTRKRIEVESCRHLSGCHCRRDARCGRPERPSSLPEGSRWPEPLTWPDCLACVRAGEHSPR